MKDRPFTSDPLFDVDVLPSSVAPNPANNTHPATAGAAEEQCEPARNRAVGDQHSVPGETQAPPESGEQPPMNSSKKTHSAGGTPGASAISGDGSPQGKTGAETPVVGTKPKGATNVASRKPREVLAKQVPPKPQLPRQRILTIFNAARPDGLAEVDRTLETVYAEARGGHLAELKEAEAEVIDGRAAIEAEMECRDAIRGKTPPHIEEPANTTPWTLYDRFKVTIQLLFSLVVLAAGINTVAQVLIASGVPGFEEEWRAYLFSMIPVGMAFVLKGFRQRLKTDDSRRFYEIAVDGAAVLSGTIWAYLFARIFPGLTTNLNDILNAASVTSIAVTHSSGSGWPLIFFGQMADGVIAASLWQSVESTFESHRPSTRPNPAYLKLLEELAALRATKQEESLLLGEIRNRVVEIEEGEKDFIRQGTELYHLAHQAKGFQATAAQYLNQVIS
jgi:hypothetical protein